MAISEGFIQQLVDRCDIEEIVSGYVKFIKRSGSNLFGLCPFHSEKTPSFSISRDKQIFYCFGCGKGGGVISFIMEIENLSYPDAIRHLARFAGMNMPENNDDKAAMNRARIIELNRTAARFFYECLKSPSGEPARAYIDARKISAQSVRSFGLGFAPDSWDALIKHCKESGYKDDELLAAGLCRRSRRVGNGIYDAFRNRLMFPVIDIRGDVIGFSGRTLGSDEPKYVNSQETLVFNKSKNLFALCFAKKSKRGYFILAEGNIDVVSLHQAGYDCAVASLGTSLTSDQARLLSRFSKKLIIAYDSDEAGQKASARAAATLESAGIEVKILKMRGAKDPDEFLRNNGAAAFDKLIETSQRHIEYRLESIASKFDLGENEGKVGFLREATRIVAQLASLAEREVYSMQIAEITGISNQAVVSEVERARKRNTAQAKIKVENDATHPGAALQPRQREHRYENLRSASAEEGLIRLLCLDSDMVLKNDRIPDPEDFSSPFLGRIYAELLDKVKSGTELSINTLESRLSTDEISHLTAILHKPETLSNSERALSDYIDIISLNTPDACRLEIDDYRGQEYSRIIERIKETKQRDKGENNG